MRRRTKRLIRRIRVPFEWVGIGIAWCVFGILSRRGLLRVCDFVSMVMYRFDGRGRRLARTNLQVMFGTISDVRAEKIVRRSYRNMTRTIGYAFWTCRRARVRAAEAGVMSKETKAFLAENRPAVTVSGHIGCWEILSQLAFLEGHAMMSVAKDVGTAGMTRLLMRARRSIGQEIVPASGAFRPLMQGLKEGKSLGLLVDQVVKPRDGGIWVRFFGRPVPVSAAPAFFAAKGKAPIILAWSRPLKDGRWRCEFIRSYHADECKDIWAATQRCIAALEGVIRRHPSCWVLDYRYFRKTPTPVELAQLEAREKDL